MGTTIHDLRTRRFEGRPLDVEAARRVGLDGAIATLEAFYYGLNERDLVTLDAVWAAHDLVQLNNPVGGILRGRDAIHELYRAVVDGRAVVRVAFGDAVAYQVDQAVTFAGREQGSYSVDGREVELSIRTTRCLAYLPGEGWRQVHHHGSIDDPAALAAYQRAIRGPAS